VFIGFTDFYCHLKVKSVSTSKGFENKSNEWQRRAKLLSQYVTGLVVFEALLSMILLFSRCNDYKIYSKTKTTKAQNQNLSFGFVFLTCRNPFLYLWSNVRECVNQLPCDKQLFNIIMDGR
jgi:hypothetical protein